MRWSGQSAWVHSFVPLFNVPVLYILHPITQLRRPSMLAAIATLLFAVGATPVPKATGPIPVTADSYPFMAANKSTPAFDLSKVGYVEEEYIVSGVANVYDWAADGAINVKTP